MKSARFITTISLLLASFYAWSCGPIVYSPDEYYLFHLVGLPDNATDDYNLNSKENCRLWQRQTSPIIPLEDIYQLVYKYDLETLNALKSRHIPRQIRGNKMAGWLFIFNDQEAIDLLILAKNCEWQRCQSISPWYYPSKNDPVKYSLNDVAAIAKQRAKFRVHT